MGFTLQVLKLCQYEARKLLFVMGITAVTVLVFQSLILSYENVFSFLSSNGNTPTLETNIIQSRHSYHKSATVGNLRLLNASDLTETSVILGMVNNFEVSGVEDESAIESQGERNPKDDFALEEDRDPDNVFDQDEDTNSDNEFSSKNATALDNTSAIEIVKNSENGFLLEMARKPEKILPLEMVRKSDNNRKIDTGLELEKPQSTDTGLELEKPRSTDTGLASPIQLPPVASLINNSLLRNSSSSTSIVSVTSNISLMGKQASEMLPKDEIDAALSNNISTMISNSVSKKMRCDMPPKSVTSLSEMNHLLVRRHTSLHSLRPLWPSARDQEIISAKTQIMNAPRIKSDRELYAPLFRNVSMFKRSYELMERTLKVYVYREGEKPIFHQPILKGIYASEGWFMKLMVGNKQFAVKNPRKAHLFYMPFSSRMLEYALYVRNSHNRTNLAKYLKNYAGMIAAKYPFWNRTGGSDHFFVACHDWAPYETRHHMERCIKAMCNSDPTGGFKIGKDVSLPETYVRSARNPLRDLGGKSSFERPVLAFFAGNLHGYLRPILLQYWENKDPTMKIFGPMPPGVASKMNYIQHMKSSKYCICAKGYEVNSPRVVEAIFYECVPVIISDNFVPPFFEVLDWEAFSVIVPEKDIPKLKDILLSIPEEKYHAMQISVKKVQKHFLWHSKPMKYDIFYMTLHSIWYNRVFQIRPR